MYNVCVANMTNKLIFYGPRKPIIYVTLPFIGHLSCNKVKRLLKSICFKIKCLFDLKFVFVNNFTIGSLFKFKDRLSLDMKFHVVYRLDCSNCSAGYIGLLPVHFLQGCRNIAMPLKVCVLRQWQIIHYGRDTAWTGLMLKF